MKGSTTLSNQLPAPSFSLSSPLAASGPSTPVSPPRSPLAPTLLSVPSQVRESPEDEETSMLLHQDSVITQRNEHGTENPLLKPLLPQPQIPSPFTLSPVDLDLNESHV